MMKIHATTTFMHGRTRFEAGQKYQIPGRTGGYFVHSGWATELPDTEADTLYVDIAELEGDAPLPVSTDTTLVIDTVTNAQPADVMGA
jgi:hypothetical protein